MTPKEQENFVLDYIKDWAGSENAAQKWYEEHLIPSFNMTAKQAIDAGYFEKLSEHLEQLSKDGFA